MDPVIDEVLAAIRDREWERLRPLLHPYLHWTDAEGRIVRGRKNVLSHLSGDAPVVPPRAYELRDGQVYRWHAPSATAR